MNDGQGLYVLQQASNEDKAVKEIKDIRSTLTPHVSLLIPAYNEERRIGATLKDWLTYLDSKYDESYEVLVIMDGCTDKVVSVVRKLAKSHNPIISLYQPKKLGKGGALIEAIKRAAGDVLILIDADGSMPVDEITKLMEYVGDYDLVVGSRYVDSSIILTKRPLKRVLCSRAFNVLVRLLFWRLNKIRDTQCGCKVLKRKVARIIGNSLFISDFAFDVNLIYSTLQHGFRVKEVGIKWSHRETDSKVSNKLWKISLAMFFSIVKLRIFYSRHLF
ncbi:glycosyltransferase [Candidatus Bathyarchaeota archaeon]|nr:MAG: glycosyltransferase [Candidatus Bathyarchaeota archaeon]